MHVVPAEAAVIVGDVQAVIDSGRGTLISSFAMHRTKSISFFLLQTEQGDIFKLTIVVVDGKVLV